MLVGSRWSLCVVAGLLTLPLFSESTAPVELEGKADGFLVTAWTEGAVITDEFTRATTQFLYRICLDLTGFDQTSAVVTPDWNADDLESTDDAGFALMDGISFNEGEPARPPFVISESGKLAQGDTDGIAPSLVFDDTDGEEAEVVDPEGPMSETALVLLLVTGLWVSVAKNPLFRRTAVVEPEGFGFVDLEFEELEELEELEEVEEVEEVEELEDE